MKVKDAIENIDLTQKTVYIAAMNEKKQLGIIDVSSVIMFDLDYEVLQTFSGPFDLELVISIENFNELIHKYKNSRRS